MIDSGTDAENSERFWESSDFSVSKTVLSEGLIEAENLPRFGARVTVVLQKGWKVSEKLNPDQLVENCSLSKLFHGAEPENENKIEFRIGFTETEIDRTFEDAIKSMFVMEKSEITLRVKIVASDYLNPPFKDEDNWVTITCVLILDTLQNVPPVYKWTQAQKLEAAKDLKQAGTDLFGGKRFFDAFLMYRHSLTLVYFVSDESKMAETSTEFAAEVEDLRNKCAANLVACHLQLSNHKQVVSLSSDLLPTIDASQRVKLLYRRGLANLHLQNYEKAVADLSEASLIEPENKAIARHLHQAKIKEKDLSVRMSEAMKKMFK